MCAITKSADYLPNVPVQEEAKEQGLDNGVTLDAAGYVGESSNMIGVFVPADGVFRHPQFDHIRSGCTSRGLLEPGARPGVARAHPRRGGVRHPGGRCPRCARDDAHRQFDRSGADRGVGRHADRHCGAGRITEMA